MIVLYFQDCPEGSGDFRYEQCARYNNETLRGKKYKWVPYIPGKLNTHGSYSTRDPVS